MDKGIYIDHHGRKISWYAGIYPSYDPRFPNAPYYSWCYLRAWGLRTQTIHPLTGVIINYKKN